MKFGKGELVLINHHMSRDENFIGRDSKTFVPSMIRRVTQKNTRGGTSLKLVNGGRYNGGHEVM